VDPGIFVIFGALGDLSKRKLIPALAKLRAHGHLGEHHLIVGVGRDTDVGDEAFRTMAREAIRDAGTEAKAWSDGALFYQASPSGSDEDFRALATKLASLEKEFHLPGNRVFYLSIPPAQFAPTITSLDRDSRGHGSNRVVIEKPFGRDLASAQELNRIVLGAFDESEVYRIDHYLGKETVQNLLVFRFANSIFESLWNRNHVESVQIVVGEELGVETRAGYYDKAGALRDMVQNHLTQLLCLAAMEVPVSIEADSIRWEKVKVLRSLSAVTPENAVFGQYSHGALRGAPVRGYLQEEGVAPNSHTETYVSLRLFIDNWRWKGVPFCIRTGKRLARRVTEIAVTFHRPPVCLFNSLGGCLVHSNVLLITLQPDEGFSLYFDVKSPAEPLDLKTFPLSFRYGEKFQTLPEAYETLLLDVLQGDQTLFVHSAEVEESWKFYQPLLDCDRTLHLYEPGSWGPAAAERHYMPGAPEWLNLTI
jgi:glucose-6-phosphate 1-dehydrogenase